MGGDAMEKARRLVTKLKMAKLQSMFLAWKEAAEFEQTVQDVEDLITPVADVLEKGPDQRTPEDAKRLRPLLSRIPFFQSLYPAVQDFVATYVKVHVITDNIELPRLPDDNDCMFSVLCGRLSSVVGDPGDPTIHALVHAAAEELHELEEQGKALRAAALKHMATMSKRKAQALKQQQQQQEQQKDQQDGDPQEGSGGKTREDDGGDDEGGRGGGTLSTQPSFATFASGLSEVELQRELLAEAMVDMYGLRDEWGTPYVVSCLWHTVIKTIHFHRSGGHLAAHIQLGAPEALAKATDSDGSADGSAAGVSVPLPHLSYSVSVATLNPGDSFSGRELDCRAEANLTETLELEMPSRVVAAVTANNTVSAVASITKAVFRRAMQMHVEIGVRRAVNRCCRLPFLRHTPLKELYRLARHVSELRLERGHAVLTQGKETNVMYFLVEGEVEIVVDVPDTDDPSILTQALKALAGPSFPVPTSPSGLGGTGNGGFGGPAVPGSPGVSRGPTPDPLGQNRGAQGSRSASPTPASPLGAPSLSTMAPRNGDGVMSTSSFNSRSGTPDQDLDPGSLLRSATAGAARSTTMSPARSTLTVFRWTGPRQRVLLARRGPGVVLGDDSLREKRMAVGVVVSSTTAVLLSISPQRFTMCVDPLTLRLFNKLRLQHSATAEMTDALSSVHVRKQLLDQCRQGVLLRSYEGLADPETVLAHDCTDPDTGIAGRAAEGVEGDARAKQSWQVSNTIPDILGKHPGYINEPPKPKPQGYSNLSSDASPSRHERGGARSLQQPTRGLLLAAGPSQSQAMTPRTAAVVAGGAGAPEPLKCGISHAPLVSITVSDSMTTFLTRHKQVEAERAASAVTQALRARQRAKDLVNVDERVGRKVDVMALLGPMVPGPQVKVATEMNDAACVAVIQVVELGGQEAVASEVLAPVLDDAIAQWSQLAHAYGLHLVRWNWSEFLLVTALEWGQRRRPMVRVMADVMLQMRGHFDRIISQAPVPHFVLAMGAAIGGLFCSYGCGHFMTNVSGPAHTAATKLCKEVRSECREGGILVSDAVMQALARTHCLALSTTGGGYDLLSPLALPFSTSMAGLVGQEEVDREPLSRGGPGFNRHGPWSLLHQRQPLQEQQQLQASNITFATPARSLHFGDSGRAVCLDDGEAFTLAHEMSKSASNLDDPSQTASGYLSAEPSGPVVRLGVPHSPSRAHFAVDDDGGMGWAAEVGAAPQEADAAAAGGDGNGNCVGSNGQRLQAMPAPQRQAVQHQHSRKRWQYSRRAGAPQGGVEASWNDRDRSGGHQHGQPLLTASLGELPLSLLPQHTDKTTHGEADKGTPRRPDAKGLALSPLVTRNARKREVLGSLPAMAFRDKLRQELLALALSPSQSPAGAVTGGTSCRTQPPWTGPPSPAALFARLRPWDHPASPSHPPPQPLPHVAQVAEPVRCRDHGDNGGGGDAKAHQSGVEQGCQGGNRDKNKVVYDDEVPGSTTAAVPDGTETTAAAAAAAAAAVGGRAMAVPRLGSAIARKRPLSVNSGAVGALEGEAANTARHTHFNLDGAAEDSTQSRSMSPLGSRPLLMGHPSTTLHDGHSGPAIGEATTAIVSHAKLQSRSPGGSPPRSARSHGEHRQLPASGEPSQYAQSSSDALPLLLRARSPSPGLLPPPSRQRRASAADSSYSVHLRCGESSARLAGAVGTVEEPRVSPAAAAASAAASAAIRSSRSPSPRRNSHSHSMLPVGVPARRAVSPPTHGNSPYLPLYSPSPPHRTSSPSSTTRRSPAAAPGAAASGEFQQPSESPYAMAFTTSNNASVQDGGGGAAEPGRGSSPGSRRAVSPSHMLSVPGSSQSSRHQRRSSDSRPQSRGRSQSKPDLLVASNFGFLPLSTVRQAEAAAAAAAVTVAADAEATAMAAAAAVATVQELSALASVQLSPPSRERAGHGISGFGLDLDLDLDLGLVASPGEEGEAATETAGPGLAASTSLQPIFRPAQLQLAGTAAGVFTEHPHQQPRSPQQRQQHQKLPAAASVVPRGIFNGAPGTLATALAAGAAAGGLQGPRPDTRASSRHSGGAALRRYLAAQLRDLGSQRAAEDYAACLPANILNVSFSTAGLSRVPRMQRLQFLESVALSFNGLAYIGSDQLAGLSSCLKVLNLSHSDVRSLPDDFGRLLPSLTEVSLAGNSLRRLPASLCDLARLQRLSVGHNCLTSLPDGIGCLYALQELHVGHNQLQQLPDVFHALTAMQVLHASHNALTTLPDSLTCLTALTQLAAAHNHLPELPHGTLACLANLVSLDLQHNNLSFCPEVLWGGRDAAGAMSRAPATRSVSMAPSVHPQHSTAAAQHAQHAQQHLQHSPSSASAAAAGAAEGSVSAAGRSASPTASPRAGSPRQQHNSSKLAGAGSSIGGGATGASTAGKRPSSGMSVSMRRGVPPANAPPPPSGSTTPPPVPLCLPALQRLSLAGNGLYHVPGWVGRSLQDLDLSKNCISEVPDWLCARVPRMRLLSLHSNQIVYVPRDLTRLTALAMVGLDDNPVVSAETAWDATGAGWVAEWLYTKKFRTKPEVAASPDGQGGAGSGSGDEAGGGGGSGGDVAAATPQVVS